MDRPRSNRRPPRIVRTGPRIKRDADEPPARRLDRSCPRSRRRMRPLVKRPSNERGGSKRLNATAILRLASAIAPRHAHGGEGAMGAARGLHDVACLADRLEVGRQDAVIEACATERPSASRTLHIVSQTKPVSTSSFNSPAEIRLRDGGVATGGMSPVPVSVSAPAARAPRGGWRRRRSSSGRPRRR